MPVTTGMAVPRRDLTGAFREIPAQQNFVGSQIFTPFETALDQGGFARVSKRMFRKSVDTRRQADGSYKRVVGRLTDDTYKTQEHGIEESIDRRNMAIYGTLVDYQREAADALIDLMRIRYEIDCANALQDTTTWPLSGNTGYDVTSSSTAWSDHTNANPPEDIAYAQKQARNNGLILTTLRINWVQWLDLSLNNKIRTALGYTQRPDVFIPLPILAAMMNLTNIIVCSAQYNSADDGQTPTYADVWDNKYASLLATAQSGNIQETCVGRTFFWRGDGGGTPDDPMMETYPWDPNRSDVVRARCDRQVKVISTDCHFLLKVRAS